MNAGVKLFTKLPDWDRVADDLAPINTERSASVLKRKSRDYYWFSPVLKAALDDARADIVVTPASIEELERVVRYAVTHRMPITLRGAGTGNYGQAMPLHGGLLIDMSRLTQVLWTNPEAIRAQAGIKMYDAERAANAVDRELRFFPSTWRVATLGGFVAGGSTGCGAIEYGTLHGSGNVRGISILTIEEEPRIVELRDDDVQAAIHAYGTTGIILEVELALAPLRRWHDRVIAMPDLPSLLALTERIGSDRSIGKKLLSVYGAGIATLVHPMAEQVGERDYLILTMIDEAMLPAFEAAVAEFEGEILFERAPGDRSARIPPLYELGWNHTTLHAIKADPSISYLQCVFPQNFRDGVAAVVAELGDEVPMHLEMATIDGALTCFGLPLLRFTTGKRLDKIHALLRRHGCTLFNPHTYVLESGGLQVADPVQIGFRRQSDPFGLLNPGKMPGWDAPAADA